MKPELNKHLFDIKTSIESIDEYLGVNKSFIEFKNNKLLRRGIEREIEIIGEAMNRILKIHPECKIQNARTIVDTRNWVIHNYDKVDEVILWGIVINHIPKLKVEIIELLNKTP